MTHESKPTTPNDIDYTQNKDETSSTVEKCVNIINQHTPTEWSVNNIHSKRDEHTADNPIIAGVIQHTESGSIIHIVPIDTSRSENQSPTYNAQRVRVQNRIKQTTEYVEERTPTSGCSLQNTPSEIFKTATDRITKTPQEKIHKKDQENAEKQHTNKSLVSTLVAIIGAANEIRSKQQNQTTFEGFN